MPPTHDPDPPGWTPEVWRTPEFLAELEEWVSRSVGEVRSLQRVKDRPWAAVWRVEAEAGTHFVKQNCPGQQQEARLVRLLARIDPERIVPPVAADPERDLLLTADQGPVLREHPRRSELQGALLREAMLLARATVPYVDALGLTVLDPAGIAGFAENARAGWRIPDGLRAQADRAVAAAERAGDEVAALGLPLALQHNDLHDANVFVSEGRIRFFDFGDAVVSSPLAALRFPTESAAAALGTSIDDPRVRRPLDEALEVWSDLAPLPQLHAALPAVWRLAALARAESWHRILASMPSRYVDEQFREADAEWLAEAAA
ncbi:phosphotransferase [Microbacterium sp. 22242]|uniref:phosphotransferase n=1 Tax=Microbacterium sp. 22242 TaxID=3453896 RepID=UPI003F841631